MPFKCSKKGTLMKKFVLVCVLIIVIERVGLLACLLFIGLIAREERGH